MLQPDDAAARRHRRFFRKFSTATVDAGRGSLWTSRHPGFVIKHLLRIADGLTSGSLPLTRVSAEPVGHVFHSLCAWSLYKPVDNPRAGLLQQALGTRCRFIEQAGDIVVDFSTAIVEHAPRALWTSDLSG